MRCQIFRQAYGTVLHSPALSLWGNHLFRSIPMSLPLSISKANAAGGIVAWGTALYAHLNI